MSTTRVASDILISSSVPLGTKRIEVLFVEISYVIFFTGVCELGKRNEGESKNEISQLPFIDVRILNLEELLLLSLRYPRPHSPTGTLLPYVSILSHSGLRYNGSKLVILSCRFFEQKYPTFFRVQFTSCGHERYVVAIYCISSRLKDALQLL